VLKMPCEIIVTAVKEWCEPADPPKCQEHDEPVVRLQDVAVSQMLKTQMRKKKNLQWPSSGVSTPRDAGQVSLKTFKK